MQRTTSARLLAPRLSLASCVRAYVTRSTIGCALPADDQRYNHYPATPFCSITWQVHGSTSLVENGVMSEPPMEVGQAVLCGPQSHPTLTYNPGAAAFFIVMFPPEALHALTGMNVAELVDKVCLVEDVLDATWSALAPPMANAADDEGRVGVLEAFLEPRWQQLRRSGEVSTNVVADYVYRLGVQAAATGWGRGPRIIERRIRAWAGLPMRTLQRLGRAEQAFFAARDGGAALGHIAAEHSYADQSHMTREAKAITGLSPGELLRSIDHESYWIYRIWS